VTYTHPVLSREVDHSLWRTSWRFAESTNPWHFQTGWNKWFNEHVALYTTAYGHNFHAVICRGSTAQWQ